MASAADHSRGALRGSSGATFRIEHEYRQVVKSGDNRVGEQGRYIESFGRNKTLPMIMGSGTQSYRMELLSDPSPLYLLDPVRIASEYLEMLSMTIWSHSARVLYDEGEHLNKIAAITEGDAEMFIGLNTMHDFVQWDSLMTCRTHGDPTFDNLMHRGSDLVIIDPLPPTPAVPDLASKDVGKIMMSLVGFEHFRYGTPVLAQDRVIQAIDLIKAEIGEVEFFAAAYWCVVHLMRAVPYMPTEEVASNVRELARRILRNLRP